jgi:thiamine-monophosphate kinase
MSEDGFLEKLIARLPVSSPDIVIPPGDDCAGLRIEGGRILLVAVDQIIGGRHYHLEGPYTPSPEQAGRKLLARNLSDIAAMGGHPLYFLVACGLSPAHDESWLERFFEGILRLSREFGVVMIGGDLAATPTDAVASLTIIGEVSEAQVCRRSGARPGDCLFVTGAFGRSLVTGWHLSFKPRCREGRWLVEHGFASAMIDASDGLLIDAGRLCRASGVGLRMDTAAIPLRTPETSPEEALTDGEDYELLIAAPRGKARQLRQEWPFAELPLTLIGEFTASDSHTVLGPDGIPLAPGGKVGYDHFA